MRLLISQIEFEELIGLQEPEPGTVVPNFTVIYFTAAWCSACRRLDMGAVEAATPGVNWLKCDVDQNNYTAGYCGVRSIPSFIIIRDKKVAGTLQSNDNQKVVDWVRSHMDLALAK
jgi:thioredoxin-like negative regulator of GroEL